MLFMMDMQIVEFSKEFQNQLKSYLNVTEGID